MEDGVTLLDHVFTEKQQDVDPQIVLKNNWPSLEFLAIRLKKIQVSSHCFIDLETCNENLSFFFFAIYSS